MKSLLVAIAFTVLCYFDFADSQAVDGRLLPGYAPNGGNQPGEPGGYNNQHDTQDNRAVSGTMDNFGRDGMQNGGLRAGSNVDLQNVNSPQRFMPGNLPGNLPGISSTSTDGRQFDGGSAPVNKGGTPNVNVYRSAEQGKNIGGWNSGANVLPGVNANDARGGRGFNNIPNIHQGAPRNVGYLFSDLNKGNGKLDDVIKNLMASFIRKENVGAPPNSGSFADAGKARNGFVATVGTRDPGGIQRNNNAGVPNGNFAEGYGRSPLGNAVKLPIPNGQPAVWPPNRASNVGQTPVRPANIPVAGGLPRQVNNVPNGRVANEGTRVINTPGIVQNYDSRSGLSNSNINGNPWNSPFGIVHTPFVGGQTAVRPEGISPLAPLPAVRPGAISTGGGFLHSAGQGNSRTIGGTNIMYPNKIGITDGNQRHALEGNPAVLRGTSEVNKAGTGFQENESNLQTNKVPLGTINSPATTQKQTIVNPEESSNASPAGIVKSTNTDTDDTTDTGTDDTTDTGTDVSHTSGLAKKDSIADNGSGGLDNSSQLVGSGTENVKDESIVGSNNGGDTSGTTESQASNDEIHKGKKAKGKKGKSKKGKGKKGKSKKGKSKKGKGRKGKGKKSKTASGSTSAAQANSNMQIDDVEIFQETFVEIFSEGGHAAKGGGAVIKECFDDK